MMPAQYRCIPLAPLLLGLVSLVEQSAAVTEFNVSREDSLASVPAVPAPVDWLAQEGHEVEPTGIKFGSARGFSASLDDSSGTSLLRTGDIEVASMAALQSSTSGA